MAARRCSTCARNYALDALACPVCGGELWHTEDDPADVDDGAMDAFLTAPESDLWRYRVRRFRALGFTRQQRVRLASEGADWHEARELVGRGCPLELVFDLLSS